MLRLTIIAMLFCAASLSTHAQMTMRGGSGNMYYNRIFDADRMQYPPVFVPGKDSLQRFYLSNFTAFDSVAYWAINAGDTAKYIRVYVSFVIDENGALYNPKFEKVGTTRYAASENTLTVKYFFDHKPTLQVAVEEMLQNMPMWRPGLENNIKVKATVHSYFQFWLGINPPPPSGASS